MSKPQALTFLPHLAPVRAGSPLAYGISVICVLAAVGLELGLGLIAPDVAPFATLFTAVLAAGVAGGLKAGALALTLGTLLGWYLFLEPRQSLAAPTTGGWINLVVYTLASIAVLAVAAGLRRALIHLAQARARLEVALEAAQVGTWSWDVERDTVAFDDGARRVFGMGREEPAPRVGSLIRLIDPADRDRVTEEIRRGQYGDAALESQFRIRPTDGSVRWISVRGRLYPGPDGPCLTGACVDVTEAKRAEERQSRMMRELNHRVKNNLAVAISLTRQSARHARSLEELKDTLAERFVSLSRTHELLAGSEWRGGEVASVLQNELAPYLDESTPRVALEGPTLPLDAKRTISLAMIVHELAANSAKYGALSDSGRVNVCWEAEEGEVRLHWKESGGPEVQTPVHKGFGSKLIAQIAGYDLGGRSNLVFAPDGVRADIAFPLPAAHEPGAFVQNFM